jgi:TolA-binding protein
MSRTPARPDAAPAASDLPTWMRWGGAGLTALLAVLFVVLLLQVRGQGQRLQALQDRIQSLENAQDLERTNALEEQLRSTVQRLQNLEGIEQSLQRLSSEQENLRLQLRSAGSRKGSGDLEPVLPPELPEPSAPSSSRDRPGRPVTPPPAPTVQP